MHGLAATLVPRPEAANSASIVTLGLHVGMHSRAEAHSKSHTEY